MKVQLRCFTTLLSFSLLAGCGEESDTVASNSAPVPQPSFKAATVVSDTMRFPGSAALYAIALTSDGYTVTTQGGSPGVLPANIKRIDFDDISFGLGASSN